MHGLAIGLTNRCPLRCDFCCVPPGRGDLPDDVVARLVREAVESSRFATVGFTGGEPLLRWRTVVGMGRILHEAGIRWGFTTGLGWARDRAHLLKVADAILDAGVYQVNVSVDPSHLAFVDRGTVESFLDHLGRAGVPRILVSSTVRDRTAELPITVPPWPTIATETHHVAPVGYASAETPAPGYRFSMAESACPLRDGLTLSVWPDGAVYPCCSAYVVNKEVNHDLIVGNVFESPITEILDRAVEDPYLTTIRRSGFAGLVVLDPRNPLWATVFDQSRQPLLNPCHLCSRVSAERGAIASLREKAGQEKTSSAGDQRFSGSAPVGRRTVLL